MKKAIINYWEFKYSENEKIRIERFITETEMNKFIKSIIKNSNAKYIGKSRDITYPIGFDFYNEAELEKMEYVERAAI